MTALARRTVAELKEEAGQKGKRRSHKKGV